MSLFVVEGARKSGKTYLINSQNWIPVFKFDFNGIYVSLNLPERGEKTHGIGLGKELMIHQLNRDGFIPDIIMDRGVITNSVWGILNGRVSKESVYSEIDYMVESNLFKDTFFFYIDGTSTEERKKDVWDYMDNMVPEEKRIFEEIIEYLEKKGIKVEKIENTFDASSLFNFQSVIKRMK